MAMDSEAVHQSGGAGDDEEIGVFTAERYFSGADVDAVWCGRSSSSLSSAFKNGCQQEYWSAAPTTLTAATSSSEASWNSRSVLLRDPTVSAAAESEEPSGGEGAAGVVLGGEKLSIEVADATLPGRKSKQIAAEVVATTSVNHGMCDGDASDAGTAMPPPLLQLAEPRRIADSGELSARVLNPRAAAAALSDERRRRSSDMFASATTQQNSAFTIIAGSTAPRDGAAAADGGGGAENRDPSLNRACATSRRDADDAASDEELECVYPPSEASVVWSVVTADGVASAGNFSSAAILVNPREGCDDLEFWTANKEIYRTVSRQRN
ncbi:hypothetical protein E2562_035492, partial [Oryza meyeriana var. granulata]